MTVSYNSPTDCSPCTVVALHLRRAQGIRVNRRFVDREPGLRGAAAGPRARVVVADPPPAVVQGRRTGAGAADQNAVDEQLEQAVVEGPGDVVPLVVVLAGRAGHGPLGAVVDAEQDGAVRAHVEHPVATTGAVAGLGVAEAEDASASERALLHPGLDGEL